MQLDSVDFFIWFRLQINGAKFRTLTGADPKAETMDGAVERAIKFALLFIGFYHPDH